MELRIFWTDFAKEELKKIFDYYAVEANLKTANKIAIKIIDSADKLKDFPKLGEIEKLLENRKVEYRSLIVSNYKIIYWLNLSKNWIEIMDVFDTRQNPKTIKRAKS